MFQINGCPLPPPMRGACPEGWHLPTIEEWRILLKTDNSSTGARLKSTFGWLDDGNGMDSFGFSVLPSGYGLFNYTDNNVSTSFWSSTDETFYGTMAYQVGFHYINYSLDVRRREKWHASSVRCIKDSE
ncbi:MAG: hypothetical protein J5977_06340 [Fibrobacter sp.]|nr:hypothetical protein [Fibrobacter sp.]